MDALASSPPSFTELNDLSCEDIGGRVIFATDDWFAGTTNVNKEATNYCIADHIAAMQIFLVENAQYHGLLLSLYPNKIFLKPTAAC